MIKGRLLYDLTKASRQKHFSGLARVSSCLRKELGELLGDRFIEVEWDERNGTFRPLRRDKDFRIEVSDTLLTSELFCEYERPGVEAFLDSKVCNSYAIFHDAIPLQHPEFTWPHSVQRHPSYMKMLIAFTGVFAVSQHSSKLLEEYWEWLGFEYSPSVKSLQLGSNGVYEDPVPPCPKGNERPQLLTLGIIEKRKGQDIALEECERLWDEGLEFDLHVVGRSNPYFGRDIEKRLKQSAKSGYAVQFHGQIDDAALMKLFDKADLSLFPSRAEGCGLPVLESLWRGIPVLCSRLNSIRESSRFGGCLMFDPRDRDDLHAALKGLISEPQRLNDLTGSICSDMLPRWSATAREIVNHIVSDQG